MSPVAFIVGASGGIGATTSLRLARDGYDLALGFRSNRARTEQVAAEAPTRATVHRIDIADYADAERVVGEVIADHGRIDALVYAAGPYVPQRWISELDPELVPSVLRDDATGCWNVIRAALPHLREARGAIVSVSTPAVRRHAKKDLLSSMPKAAIEALVRGVASEEGRFGVRANAVAVGILDDGMFDQLMERGDFDEHMLEVSRKAVALGRLGNSSDIAEAVAFLVSPQRAGYVTGQSLAVDGGFAL